MAGSNNVVSTRDLWPRLAAVLGLDPVGKHITRVTIVVEMPVPVVTVEMLVSDGAALGIERVLSEYELRPRGEEKEAA